MRRWRRTGAAPAATGALLLASTALAGWSLWGAVTLDPVAPARQASPPWMVQPTEPQPVPAGPDIVAAVNADPFSPERRRPAERFRLPGERRPEPPPVVRRAPGPSFRIVGTVVLPGGGLAMLQARGAAPRTLRVGESFGGFRLARVEQGRAVFVSGEGSTHVVRVSNGGG